MAKTKWNMTNMELKFGVVEAESYRDTHMQDLWNVVEQRLHEMSIFSTSATIYICSILKTLNAKLIHFPIFYLFRDIWKKHCTCQVSMSVNGVKGQHRSNANLWSIILLKHPRSVWSQQVIESTFLDCGSVKNIQSPQRNTPAKIQPFCLRGTGPGWWKHTQKLSLVLLLVPKKRFFLKIKSSNKNRNF